MDFGSENEIEILHEMMLRNSLLAGVVGGIIHSNLSSHRLSNWNLSNAAKEEPGRLVTVLSEGRQTQRCPYQHSVSIASCYASSASSAEG